MPGHRRFLQKILTNRRPWSDFGSQRRRFVSPRRRFVAPKRRLVLAFSNLNDYQRLIKGRKSTKIFDKFGRCPVWGHKGGAWFRRGVAPMI
jgi:hypothetical protein